MNDIRTLMWSFLAPLVGRRKRPRIRGLSESDNGLEPRRGEREERIITDGAAQSVLGRGGRGRVGGRGRRGDRRRPRRLRVTRLFYPVIIIAMNMNIIVIITVNSFAMINIFVVTEFRGDHHFRPNSASEKGRSGARKRLLPGSAVDVDDLEDAINGSVEFVKALSGRCVVRNVDAPVEGRVGGRGGEEALDGIEVKEEEEDEREEERRKKLAVMLAEATRCWTCFRRFRRLCFCYC